MKCPQCFKEVPDLNYKCPHCAAVLKGEIDPDQFRAAADRKRTLRVSTLLLVVLIVAGAVFLFISVNRSEGNRPQAAVQETGNSLPAQQSTEPGTLSETAASNTETEAGLNAEEPSDADQQTGDPVDAVDPPPDMDPGEETETEEPSETPDYEEPEVNYPGPRVTQHNPGEEVGLRDMSYPGRTTIFDFYSDYCGPCRQISPLLEALDRKREDIEVVKIDINRPGIRGIDWQSPVAVQYGLPGVPYFIIYNAQRRESHSGDAARERVFALLQEENIR